MWTKAHLCAVYSPRLSDNELLCTLLLKFWYPPFKAGGTTQVEITDGRVLVNCQSERVL